MNQRILEILLMCLQAKENGHDCFFSYYPHTSQVDITIHLKGWVKGSDPDHSLSACVDIKSPMYNKSALGNIDRILERLT